MQKLRSIKTNLINFEVFFPVLFSIDYVKILEEECFILHFNLITLCKHLPQFTHNIGLIEFPVWLPNQLISAGLEPVLRHTETSDIVSYHKQFCKSGH